MLLWVGCMLITACNTNTVNFSYSPLQPKAGETIQFTNLSTKGEEWEWAFGDASTSTGKNPTKVYKQAGTYTVILKVDDKSNWKVSKSITVYDTVPGFECSVAEAETAGIPIFEDATFTAQVYNPYNYKVDYEWRIGSNRLYKPLSPANEQNFKLYFEQASSDAEEVHLAVTLNGLRREVKHSYKINNVLAPSILMMTADSVYWRQRIFGNRADFVYRLTPEDVEGKALLDATQDTLQIYKRSC